MLRFVVFTTHKKGKSLLPMVSIYVRNGVRLPHVGEKVCLEIDGEVVRYEKVKSVNPEKRTYTISVGG